MYKKMILLVLILVISMGYVSADDNSTADVKYVDGGDFRSIGYAIDDASENDIVELNGTYVENYGQINIEKSITLQSSQNNAILDLNHTDGFININKCNVTFKNLKFINLDKSYEFITAADSNLTVINCSFESIGYNAINFQGFSLSVDNCRFYKGANGAIVSQSSNTVINNSFFTNQEFEGIVSMDKKLTVENCIFKDLYTNSITAECGEVYLKRNTFKGGSSDWDAALLKTNKSYIDSCIFDNCGWVSVRNVSDILNCSFTNVCVSLGNPVKINIINSRFLKKSELSTGNTIKNINLINNTFEKTVFEDSIYISNVKVINNTINGNFLNAYTFVTKKVYIKNSQFLNNKFAKDMFVLRPDNEYSIFNNVFSNNVAPQILFVKFDEKNSKLEVYNNVFANNFDKKGNFAQIKLDPYYYEYYDKSGNIVGKSLTTVSIGNNFLGFNLINAYELETINPINYHNSSWINVEFKQISQENNSYKYTLNFVDKDGNIFKLPNYNFKIQDRKTGEILIDNIQIKSGKATFVSDKKLSLDDIFIINDAGSIVNRPKPEITIKRTGSNYDNTEITVTLSYHNTYLKNQVVGFDISTYSNAKSFNVHHDSAKTNAGGIATLGYALDTFYDHFDIKAKFASKDFAFVSATIKNIKVSVASVTLKASKLVTTYKSGKTFNVKVLNSKNQPVKFCQLAVKLQAKNGWYTYNTYTDEDGVARVPVSGYGIGTFKVVVTKGDENHKMKNINTKLTIKKAQTTVSAIKKVKKSSKIKITIKNKASKKFNSGIKVKVKVFTGKSFKTYNLKTNSKGIVSISAKKFSIGTHKVIVSSSDSRYSVSSRFNVRVIK